LRESEAGIIVRPMVGGSSITGAAAPAPLQVYEQLLARWTLLRTTIGAERAEADRELIDRGRAAWDDGFKIIDVQREARGGRRDCFCGDWGYLPLWAAQLFESGLRVDLYASAWGWHAVYCLMCRSGAGLSIDDEGIPDGDQCSVCDGAGIAPAWVSDLLRGSPGALDREQTATGWFPSCCDACGGWGRQRTVTADEVVVAGVTEEIPVKAPGADAASEEPSLRRSGTFWNATYRGKTVPVTDRVGAAYVACLLDRPYTAVPATELIAMRNAAVGSMTPGQAIEAGLHVAATSDLGFDIDEGMLRTYKERCRAIGGEIDQAERDNDEGRRQGLVHERELLLTAIVAAVGKGGRLRKTQPERRRARDSVQKAIKDFLSELAEAHQDLGEHLRASISCGDSPVYRPR
jgi:hypothetical protein